MASGRRCLVVLATAAAVVLGACGGSDSGDDEPPVARSGESCGPTTGELRSAGGAGSQDPQIATSVTATVETAPVRHGGDAADDPAIWVHPEQPSLSVVLGTDKRGGIGVYELNGLELDHRPDGEINNVDLRCDYRLGGRAATIVTAGNRTDNTIAIYRLDTETRRLAPVAARPIEPGVRIYGSCMYKDPRSGRLFHFATSQSGRVEQWELIRSGGGRIDGKLVRRFAFDSTAEACVADDETGQLYVSEEERGVWKMSARPNRPARPQLVARTQAEGGELEPDAEGLTLVHAADGGKLLIVSSQGDDSFAVYRAAGDHPHLGSFEIEDSDAIDGASETDGIDATAADLGPQFPGGLFVAQDGDNDGDNQNFKFVPLEEIIQE